MLCVNLTVVGCRFQVKFYCFQVVRKRYTAHVYKCVIKPFGSLSFYGYGSIHVHCERNIIIPNYIHIGLTWMVHNES